MNSHSSFSRRLLVYVLIVLIVIGSCFGVVAGTVGLDDWVSYLIVGIIGALMLAFIVGNEIHIGLLRRKSKK